MKPLLLAVAVVLAGSAAAQMRDSSAGSGSTPTTEFMAPDAQVIPPATVPHAERSTGQAHVAEPQPARRGNSFTEAQARGRITRAGFHDISSLKLDRNGIWRGGATKAGRRVDVWLDYKGSVGQQ